MSYWWKATAYLCTLGYGLFGIACAAPGGALHLEISTLDRSVRIAQPLRLMLKVRVQGEPVSGGVLLQPSANHGQITVTGPGGIEVYPFAALTGKDPRVSADVLPPRTLPTLQPGTSFDAEVWVAYDRRHAKYIFDASGLYVIQASLNVYEGVDYEKARIVSLVSNRVSVQVEKPSPSEGADLWQVHPQAIMFLSGEDVLGTLASEYEGSSYAHYARFALASDERSPLVERIKRLQQTTTSPNVPIQLLDLSCLLLADLLIREHRLQEAKMSLERVLLLDSAPQCSKDRAQRGLDAIARMRDAQTR